MNSPTVDVHCHLDLYRDPASVVAKCRAESAFVLSVTTTPKAWRGTVALTRGALRIRTSLGFHPQIAHERLGELPLFEGLLPETRYVGEVGLDGSPDSKPHWRQQSLVFDKVLELAAKAGGRIFTVHSRRAATEVLDALHRRPDAGIQVLHWFSGTQRELARAVGMGCYFSVGPAMLRGQRGHALVSAMPPNRVLTETDGPFALIDGRPLNPAEVESAIDGLASAWKMTRQEARSKVLDTFKHLVASQVGGPAADI